MNKLLKPTTLLQYSKQFFSTNRRVCIGVPQAETLSSNTVGAEKVTIPGNDDHSSSVPTSTHNNENVPCTVKTSHQLRFNPDALPPKEVTGVTAICDGSNNAGLGHPREFIRVNYQYDVRCKYCGQRYRRVHGKGGHHH